MFADIDHWFENLNSTRFLWGSCCSIFSFLCNVLSTIVCPFSLFFFDVRLLITFMVSSNFSYVKFWPVNMKKFISVWIFIKKTILIFIISHNSHFGQIGQVLRPWLWKRITQLNFEKQSEGQEAFVFQLKHM